MFKPFFQKIQKGFPVSASRGLALSDDAITVPDDVEEGYFTVFTVQEIETQRFVIKLDNPINPACLSLLEQARDEHGFQQKGALSVPCRPQELRQILEDRYYQEKDATECWAAYDVK
ncbi:SAUR-like auxin-responsive protein family, putative [Theobroma cacao]|uniref:SAUR-like auxin-responsive protein family, putative n=1 Tax=Theobroma cacao TaxID=3641 RepID=A0A061F063_THECC|nr:SAUR-like auxin-responsive protein family, putative [Theobroma cacao]